VLRVNNVYRSVQGEGVYSGEPFLFVRLQGCNQRCTYCDTEYAQGLVGGRDSSVSGILEELVVLDPRAHRWVCITGGEPLLQADELVELVRRLNRGWYRTEVETNGTFPKPHWWTLVDSWVPDIKCPSSGVRVDTPLVNDWFNTRPQDQIKFVVGTEEDLHFAETLIRKHSSCNPRVLLSPVWPTNYNSAGDGVCIQTDFFQRVVELCKSLDVRFSLQTQKIVWRNAKDV